MDDAIANFVGITGASDDAARQVIEMCAGNLEQAIQLWFTDEELQRNLTNPSSAPAASSSTAAPPTQAPAVHRPNIGREDVNGVIHIDSDDDDVPMGADNDESSGFDDSDIAAVQAATVARTAQEEEDAAMAKRLQEELFSGNVIGEDSVRAPMARTTETLVAPGGFDDGEDMHAAMLEDFRRRQRMRARNTNNPFGQSIWDDHSNPTHPALAAASNVPGTQTSRQARLAELFRPPYDIMSDLPWDDVRTEGKEEKKWILVNLQDMSDFNCQALNRDVWKDEAIKQLIQENFIFLQYDKTDERSQQYINFYLPNRTHENPDNYPHVSIVDPRTGEQVKVWSGIPFPNALELHAQLVEFLDRYSLAANSKNPVVKAKRPEKVVNVDRMTEEEMLEMALQNSLETNGGSAGPNVLDPDELTKSVELGSAKGKEVAGAASAEEPSSQSAFAKIPSDKPHTEPENNPALTTRIQFRHPTGRIIRRFSLNDPVSRIYEWLKATPLEGKEGVEFELKAMPQGHDLIDDLGKTVAEAGLKQGTVMIEFIQD